MSKKEKQIQWRRNKVYEYLVKGVNQNEIAELLHVCEATIHKDVVHLRNEAREQIQTHMHERIPMEYNKCISGIDEILKHAWLIATKGDEKTKLQALTLANECYKHKMDLITNGVIIDDALKFVNEHKNNIKLNDEIDTELETTKNTLF